MASIYGVSGNSAKRKSAAVKIHTQLIENKWIVMENYQTNIRAYQLNKCGDNSVMKRFQIQWN